MIHSFGNRTTEDLYNGVSNARVRRLPQNIKESALYKLDILNSVGSLDELRSPPGNRLEALKGDYAGFHSIRINSQWRIVFQWEGSGAHEVEIVDYH
ncbi:MULTISPECIES: type II toxin-antitoxin system RelE/ParE family toxin [unclassified Marinobacter]|jgi:proteic killer suppression protein|uniref:type II toxin-antitoxin system RelE/ParE family toxin n=1 Tax=unclassified Marinobacter TaxID=83889 RepID=UPI00257F37EC|nr:MULTISPECIES: type II toxin-antitoxin system RelE/ParE family toxin [unclassified Marinobacter]|tara:strand:- start:1418 stop:1708 length:291 start_codon:yes stop_codon:yes gene_type:complete